MIKSATIIEVILALVIIMLTMGIALMIYLNITNSQFTIQQLNAHLLINDISINTTKNIHGTLEDEVIEKDQSTMYKSIIPYKDIPNLYLLHLEVMDKHNKKLAERKELIIINN